MAGKSKRDGRDGKAKDAASGRAEAAGPAAGGEAAEQRAPDRAPAAAVPRATRRMRTPPPSPVGAAEAAPRRHSAAETPKPRKRRPARAAGPAASARRDAGHLGGPGAPHRTPPPAEGEVGPQRRAEPVLGLVTEPLQQMRFLQDFFRTPVPVSLAPGQAEAASPPAEIGARISELSYQLKVLGALQTVLAEELQTLERNLPAGREVAAEDAKPPAQNGPAA